MPDHGCTCCCRIPPKHAVSQVVGYIKGKRWRPHGSGVYGGRKRNFVGQHFWGPEVSS